MVVSFTKKFSKREVSLVALIGIKVTTIDVAVKNIQGEKLSKFVKFDIDFLS